ncbi:MAG: 23S rRNA (adenine(2503)-C(2))-methyltransferase RlmN [Candidatus Omnitrophica bacterium]|nr:23S rRNA (adenine(2503)-C(2))-methyltransferase RlmN [Candidatus Omnitrophota bacterium]
MQQDIKKLTVIELQNILKGWGASVYHAKQVFNWIYKLGARDFSAMSDLSAGLRIRLEENFFILGSGIAEQQDSVDGTQKFLIRLHDASLIEAVVIPAEGRVTGCISSQVGCKYACTFCASGQSGLKRNLTSTEILEEILLLNSGKKITHIVFMGIGEPLDNYDEVLRAIRAINSPDGIGIGARRITISTCGVIPAIGKLAQEKLQIELSISLHAADDLIRSQIMPVNKKYPLKALMAACQDYIKKTDRQITFEYVLIKGLNSDLQSVKDLAKILKPLRLAKVNLIPSNPIKEMNVQPPGKLEVLYFKDYLIKQGIQVTLRKSRGQDIDAACGQLRLKYDKR